ncbi:hypothetical protein [Lactococcus petauri]|uniref:Uncharacterized protein n=1 Tax=Lactococcus petauri TaxID=1940789 RepID=A0A252CB66_9LACT|nr:hypothetical protein [Lactococcus petauri]MDC0826645.1 hypothetical protein [Lactococcus petauri]OUK03794.1 hypothetical protein BZZ03_09070 [Lactococcus petauri]USI65100.1 hypothetical protein LMK05_09675 [Lactococcus petauri]
MYRRIIKISVVLISVLGLTLLLWVNFFKNNSINNERASVGKKELVIEYVYEITENPEIRLFKKEEISNIDFDNGDLIVHFQDLQVNSDMITFSLDGNNDEASLTIYRPRNATNAEAIESKNIPASQFLDLKKLRLYVEK